MMYNKRRISFGIHLRHPYNKAGDGPEGPEVRVTTEWLHSHFVNSIIRNIIYNEKSSLFRNGTWGGLSTRYPLTILNITCKGKHIIWTCKSTNDEIIYFHNHLGMSGRWCPIAGNHSNIQLVTEKDGILTNLFFDDARRFGDFSILYSSQTLSAKLKNIGMDLMDTAIKYYNGDKGPVLEAQQKWLSLFNKLKGSYRSKDKYIYVFLMEQKHFSGIGAYLAAEILYNCKVSPQRKISEINNETIIQLFNNSIETIYLSYRYGGLTVKDFWDPEGRIGKFPRKIYGNKKDPDGFDVIKTKFSNGRSCQWVREVQI